MATPIAMLLKTYLAENDLTLAEFARRIEVKNARTVQRYVTGTRRPSGKMLARIAEETGGKVMPNDFLIPAEG